MFPRPGAAGVIGAPIIDWLYWIFCDYSAPTSIESTSPSANHIRLLTDGD